MDKPENFDISEFEGKGINNLKFKGFVKVVTSYDMDLKKLMKEVNQNTVFVCDSASSTFDPVIKKAGAIVNKSRRILERKKL